MVEVGDRKASWVRRILFLFSVSLHEKNLLSISLRRFRIGYQSYFYVKFFIKKEQNNTWVSEIIKQTIRITELMK